MRTRDPHEAEKILNSLNEVDENSVVAREAAIRVLQVTDEGFVQRSWEQVIADVVGCPTESIRERRFRKLKSHS